MKKIKYLLVAILATFTIILTGSKVFAAETPNLQTVKVNDWKYKIVDAANDDANPFVTWNNIGQKISGQRLGGLASKTAGDIKDFTIEYDGKILLRFQADEIMYHGDLNNVPIQEIEISSVIGIYNDNFIDYDYLMGFSIMDGDFDRANDPNYTLYVNLNGAPNSKPAISGKDAIVNNVSSPYSQEQIRKIAEIKAIDEYYGDITDDIEMIRDTWTSNKNKLGIYEQEYSITNGSGITTNYVLKITNYDLDKPIITGPGNSTISYTKTITNNDIIALYAVTDNYDTSVSLIVENTNYVPGKVGTYQFTLSATDTSKNQATKIHTLKVVDDIAPIITDNNEGKIQLNWKDKITDAKLLLGLTASDAIDGDLTKSINIIENTLSNVVGDYVVKYEVSDASGNVTKHERTYQVVTTAAAEFFVSKNLLSIEDINVMNIDQLVAVIASYENIQVQSFEILKNEYEGNEKISGQYLLSMKIVDVNNEEHRIERTIKVFNAADLNEEPKAKTIWQKIADFFVNLWNGIKAFFKWLRKILAAPFKWVISLFK